MVTSFVSQFLADLLLLSVFSIPLVLVARHVGRKRLIRNFALAAAIVAAVAASIATSSEILVQQCFDAGNTGCVDFGSAGFRMLLLGGYIIAALGEAYLVAQD